MEWRRSYTSQSQVQKIRHVEAYLNTLGEHSIANAASSDNLHCHYWMPNEACQKRTLVSCECHSPTHPCNLLNEFACQVLPPLRCFPPKLTADQWTSCSCTIVWVMNVAEAPPLYTTPHYNTTLSSGQLCWLARITNKSIICQPSDFLCTSDYGPQGHIAMYFELFGCSRSRPHDHGQQVVLSGCFVCDTWFISLSDSSSSYLA